MILVISPRNYPFQLVLFPAIGSIAAGNTVFLKPSEMIPNIATILKEIIEGVCLPEHVIMVEGVIEISQELLATKGLYFIYRKYRCRTDRLRKYGQTLDPGYLG